MYFVVYAPKKVSLTYLCFHTYFFPILNAIVFKLKKKNENILINIYVSIYKKNCFCVYVMCA